MATTTTTDPNRRTFLGTTVAAIAAFFAVPAAKASAIRVAAAAPLQRILAGSVRFKPVTVTLTQMPIQPLVRLLHRRNEAAFGGYAAGQVMLEGFFWEERAADTTDEHNKVYRTFAVEYDVTLNFIGKPAAEFNGFICPEDDLGELVALLPPRLVLEADERPIQPLDRLATADDRNRSHGEHGRGPHPADGADAGRGRSPDAVRGVVP